nr:hypothetical transcript [Hymenolepis microstoma]
MAQKEVDIFGGLRCSDESCNYTMVVTEYFIRPSSAKIAYVEHNDHMHIVFSSSPSNSTRRAKRLLEEMNVPAEQWATWIRTKQLVRNISALFHIIYFMESVKAGEHTSKFHSMSVYGMCYS